MILNETQLKAYEYGLAHHPNLNKNCKVDLLRNTTSEAFYF